MFRRQFLKGLATAPIAGRTAVKEIVAQYSPEVHALAEGR